MFSRARLVADKFMECSGLSGRTELCSKLGSFLRIHRLRWPGPPGPTRKACMHKLYTLPSCTLSSCAHLAYMHRARKESHAHAAHLAKM